jgi:glycine hydroxymethyltransferase
MSFIQQLTNKEFLRQKNSLNLIASENFPSPKTLQLLGSPWSNKYGEGYPGKRYYAGNGNTDILEQFTMDLALKIFDKTGDYGVNLQVLSGSNANSVVYLSMLDFGDKILSLSLAEGGHLSHLHATSVYNKFFEYCNYKLKNVGVDDYELDLVDFENQLKKHRPKLTIIGFSAYTKKFDFSKLIKIAHEYNSLVLADIAHISGLVAAGFHSSPFAKGLEGADFITTTTHKTFRGPRGAMLFAKKEYIAKLNKDIFPGLLGGPYFNKIAAIGQACEEVLGDESYPDSIKFNQYIENTLINTKALENSLVNSGLDIVSPTENHLLLLKLPQNVDSLELQNKLEDLGVVTNRNPIPGDTKSPWRPGGLRLGGAALTSRGFCKEDFEELGRLIAKIVLDTFNSKIDSASLVELIKVQQWYYSE